MRSASASRIHSKEKKLTIKILIVDDDSGFRALCKRMLRKCPDQVYLLEEAVDAASAVETFSKNAFDCVLVDYRLPDMSGTDLIRTLRKSSGPAVPMILLSASNRDDMAEAKGLAEATSFLSKSEIGNLGLPQLI